MGLFAESIKAEFNESLNSAPYEYELTKSPRGQDMFANFEDEDGVAYRVEFVGSSGLGMKVKRVRVRQKASGRTYREPNKRFKDPMRVMATMVHATGQYLATPIGKKVEGIGVEFGKKTVERGSRFVKALIQRNPELKKRLTLLDADFTVDKVAVWAVRKGKNPEAVFDGEKVAGLLGQGQTSGGEITADTIMNKTYSMTLEGRDELMEDLLEVEDLPQDFGYYFGSKGFDDDWHEKAITTAIDEGLSVPDWNYQGIEVSNTVPRAFYVTSRTSIVIYEDMSLAFNVNLTRFGKIFKLPQTATTSLKEGLERFVAEVRNQIEDLVEVANEASGEAFTGGQGITNDHNIPFLLYDVSGVQDIMEDDFEGLTSTVKEETILGDKAALVNFIKEIVEELEMEDDHYELPIPSFVKDYLKEIGFVVVDSKDGIELDGNWIKYKHPNFSDDLALRIYMEPNSSECILEVSKGGEVIRKFEVFVGNGEDVELSFVVKNSVFNLMEALTSNPTSDELVNEIADELSGHKDVDEVQILDDNTVGAELSVGGYITFDFSNRPHRTTVHDSDGEIIQSYKSVDVDSDIEKALEFLGSNEPQSQPLPETVFSYASSKGFTTLERGDGSIGSEAVFTHPDLNEEFQILVSKTSSEIGSVSAEHGGIQLSRKPFSLSSPYDFKMKFDEVVGKLYLAYNDAQGSPSSTEIKKFDLRYLEDSGMEVVEETFENGDGYVISNPNWDVDDLYVLIEPNGSGSFDVEMSDDIMRGENIDLTDLSAKEVLGRLREIRDFLELDI